MSKVYIVAAEHPLQSGIILEVFATKADGNTRAAEIANQISDDYSGDCRIPPATPGTWEATVEAVQNDTDYVSCWLEVREVDLQ